jgi:3-hydroxyanthranilate 3,4-dioxygenase
VHVSDLAAQLPQAFDAFHADAARRTCARCGTLHPGR